MVKIFKTLPFILLWEGEKGSPTSHSCTHRRHINVAYVLKFYFKVVQISVLMLTLFLSAKIRYYGRFDMQCMCALCKYRW